MKKITKKQLINLIIMIIFVILGVVLLFVSYGVIVYATDPNYSGYIYNITMTSKQLIHNAQIMGFVGDFSVLLGIIFGTLAIDP